MKPNYFKIQITVSLILILIAGGKFLLQNGIALATQNLSPLHISDVLPNGNVLQFSDLVDSSGVSLKDTLPVKDADTNPNWDIQPADLPAPGTSKTYTIKFKVNNCTSGSPLSFANQISASWINGFSSQNPPPVRSQTLDLKCPITVIGDVFSKDKITAPVKVLGPGLVVLGTNTDLPANTAGSNVTVIKDYGLPATITGQINTAKSALDTLNSTTAKPLPSLSGTFNLNQDNNPTGGLWKTAGDLTLDDNPLTGKGTIIVNGNLTINDNFKGVVGNSDMLGLYVTGKVQINNVMDGDLNIKNVGLFAPNGTITINHQKSQFIWNGFILGNKIVFNTPADSRGGSITWSGLFDTSPLIGFDSLAKAIVNEQPPQ